MGEFQAYTYDSFRELNAKLLTGEDIAPVREQNREAQGLYAMVSIRDEAGRSHGYMAVVLSMDATIQAERDFLTHIICVLLLITAVLAVLSILTAQHILKKADELEAVKKALASVPTGTPTDDWTAFAKATKLKAGVLKKIRPFITEKDPTAQPIEGECDSDLRDTELVPFTYAGGITGFMRDEVLT